ncbi:Crp/Fnr family transcriptional regulator [Aquabacterium sp.]|uniref:Crp/Fnr family transcriptional regulator n=1 Tax=Aquabacterium sp. TaxID=1872578 RepID=UPI0035B08E35
MPSTIAGMFATDGFQHYLLALERDLWFGRLPRRLTDQMLRNAELRRLVDKQSLFLRGDAPSGLYCVLEGGMRVTGLTDAGKEAILTLLQPLAWFGEIALFDGLPRTHDVVAEGAAVLLHVPQPALDAILAQCPEYWREFGLLMALKLRLAFIGIEDLSLLSADARMARRLVYLAQGRMPQRAAAVPVGIDVSQEQLALMLALSRQTANKILKGFEQDGAVRVHYGHIEVLDLAKLKQLGGVSAHEEALTQSRPGLF